jgi:hypothetical protein
VQTGVVMVIYLEDAVERKRQALGGSLTRAALRDAVMDGAVLRLRPKLMTVSTVVAGLLPIMWSTTAGAEVMKPLATPVLGGMISSLLHVLIVTPVIYCWLHERRLEPVPEEGPAVSRDGQGRFKVRRVVIGLVAVAAIAAGAIVWRSMRDGGGVGQGGPAGSEVQRLRSGSLDVIVRSPAGTLRQGRNTFTIEFRAADGGALVDIGTLKGSANMPMPGMVMSSGLDVQPTGVAGRYQATAEFGMAGAWQFALEWSGPAGRGAASFEGTVR